MNQKCSKLTFTSVCVLCVFVTVGALTFWLWPRGDDMETRLETNGNDNKIETYAIIHIKFIKGPRRARKDTERASMMDRLTEMEEVMLEMGYLKKKKNLKKHKKTKTQNVTTKKIKTKTRRNTIEDSVEEESDN